MQKDRGCVFQEYLFGCGRRRGREGKGEHAERGDSLTVESWACGK